MPKRRLFFADACREKPIDALLQRNPSGDPLVTGATVFNQVAASAAYYAAADGLKAYGPSNEVTYFASALLEALEGAGSLNRNGQWRVDTFSLGNAASGQIMASLAAKYSQPLTCNPVPQGLPAPIHFPVQPFVRTSIGCQSVQANERAGHSSDAQRQPVTIQAWKPASLVEPRSAWGLGHSTRLFELSTGHTHGDPHAAGIRTGGKGMSDKLTIGFAADMPEALVEVVSPDLQTVDRFWLGPGGRSEPVDVPSEASFLRIHLPSGGVVNFRDPGNRNRQVRLADLQEKFTTRTSFPGPQSSGGSAQRVRDVLDIQRDRRRNLFPTTGRAPPALMQLWRERKSRTRARGVENPLPPMKSLPDGTVVQLTSAHGDVAPAHPLYRGEVRFSDVRRDTACQLTVMGPSGRLVVQLPGFLQELVCARRRGGRRVDVRERRRGHPKRGRGLPDDVPNQRRPLLRDGPGDLG